MSDPKRDVEMTEEELAKAAGGRRGRTEERDADRGVTGAGRPDALTDEQLKGVSGGRRARTRTRPEDDNGGGGPGSHLSVDDDRGISGSTGPSGAGG